MPISSAFMTNQILAMYVWLSKKVYTIGGAHELSSYIHEFNM